MLHHLENVLHTGITPTGGTEKKRRKLLTVYSEQTDYRRRMVLNSCVIFKTKPNALSVARASNVAKLKLEEIGLYNVQKDCINPGITNSSVIGIYTAFVAAMLSNDRTELDGMLADSQWWLKMANGTRDAISAHIDELIEDKSAEYSVTETSTERVIKALKARKKIYTVEEDRQGNIVIRYGYLSTECCSGAFMGIEDKGAYMHLDFMFDEFKQRDEDVWSIPKIIGGGTFKDDIIGMLKEHEAFEEIK